MSRRLLILPAVVCALVAVTTSASARSERRFNDPCGKLLTEQQAEAAMGEPRAFKVTWKKQGNSWFCTYAGGANKSLDHSLGLQWGPYSYFRTHFVSGDLGTAICSADKDACRDLKRARAESSNLKSFNDFAHALGRVGVTKRLRSPAFDQNPALIWRPDTALAAASELAWVFVYDTKSTHLLATLCTDSAASSPDLGCAMDAAKQVYINVVNAR
jgi:hypothetical protein